MLGFQLNLSNWERGGASKLLSKTGNQCVIGQIASQIGINSDHLLNEYCLSREALKEDTANVLSSLGIVKDWVKTLSYINDNINSTDIQKIEMFKQYAPYEITIIATGRINIAKNGLCKTIPTSKKYCGTSLFV